MPDFESLGLNRETVEAVAIAYTGYATAQRRLAIQLEERAGQQKERTDAGASQYRIRELEEAERAHILSASGFAISGSYFGLLNTSIAMLNFWAAAEQCTRLDALNGAVFAICSGDDALVGRFWRKFMETFEHTQLQDAVPAMLLSAWAMDHDHVAEGERVFERLHTVEGAFVGNSGIPIRLYQELVFEIRSMGDKRWRPRAALTFLNRFNERIEGAQADPRRWQRMFSRLLPLEPEILAALVLAAKAALRHDVELRVLMSDVAGVGRDIVAAAQEIAINQEAFILESTDLAGWMERAPVLHEIWQLRRRSRF